MSTAAEPRIDSAKRPRRRWRRLLFRSTLALVGILILGTSWGYWRLRSSLPKLDGTLALRGLHGDAVIERDAAGVATITAALRTDASYALGFAHAQDRFFQMDLLRRVSSGRLSELLGAQLVKTDAQFRKHKFSSLANAVVEAMPKSHRAVLDAYAQGVNQGIASLKNPPIEYLLLGPNPQAWEPTDSILVMMTMLCDLQPMDGGTEIALAALQARVSEEVFHFLVRDGSRWDAALDDSVVPSPPVPGPEAMARSTLLPPIESSASNKEGLESIAGGWPHYEIDPEFRVGSNNWAVGKSAGAEERAILASDMHLGLNVPTTWYRAMLSPPTLDGTARRLVGVTLPGAPILVEGSNGSVAWGFTNSYGDYGDVIELKSPSADSDEYQTKEGTRRLETITEEIRFPGGSQTTSHQWSIWGPVVETAGDRKLVHRWIGHDPAAFDLNLLELERAEDVTEAMEIANRAGMPNQNVLIADDQGNIGWTLSGRIPRRAGPPPLLPVDGSTDEHEWMGYLEPDEYPRLMNPPDGRLWSANNRILGDAFLKKIGNGRFDPGARARQIRDRLREKERLNESDLLAIQLDDEARFLRVWKDRLLQLTSENPDLVSKELIEHVQLSSDRASAEAVGYRIVHEFRRQVNERIFGMSSLRANSNASTSKRGLAKKFDLRRPASLSFDEVTEDLLAAQPAHWLPEEFSSWKDLLADAAQATERELSGNRPWAQSRWGIRNRAAIRHPLSAAVGPLAFLLDMPAIELPGDNHMPRVQSPSGGASQRMVVSPGKEESGFYHQPGGQSGHPLSPYYRAGFEDWAYGRSTPLLPGPAQHRLVLEPTKP